MSKRKNQSNGDDGDDDRIDFPRVTERRPPFWVEYLMVMIGGYIGGIASIETCDHVRELSDWVAACIKAVVEHIIHLLFK